MTYFEVRGLLLLLPSQATFTFAALSRKEKNLGAFLVLRFIFVQTRVSLSNVAWLPETLVLSFMAGLAATTGVSRFTTDDVDSSTH